MVVLVSRGSFRWYLKMLQKLGIVARIPVIVIRSHNQLAEFLGNLSAGDKRQRWIVGRKLYINMYARLSGSDIEQSILII